MKKIFLCSMLIFCGFVSYGIADDNPSCNMSDGKVCAQVNVGGGKEEDRCVEATFEPGTGRYSWCALNINKYWYDAGHVCDPANAPRGSGHCISSGWDYSNVHCKDGKGKGEKKTKCNCDGKDTENLWTHITSCAAKYCNDGYLLYMTNSASRTDRKKMITDAVVSGWKDHMLNELVASQGLCRSRAALQKACDTSCKCGDGEKCVLNEVTVKNYGEDVAAYVGEEMCVCVSQNGKTKDGNKPGKTEDDNKQEDEPVVETTPDCDNPCEVRQKISVICPDGRSGLNTDKLLYKICPDDLKKLGLKSSSCPEVQRSFDACRDADCIKKLINDVNLYNELIKAVCETGTGSASGSTGNSSVGGTSASEISAAQKTLDDFYAWAKKDKNRSAWKDAEGNFNTARLASDLTAGVVLGTVGGVVSGVVIKKKQVEKGFDALHCTVGGQPVADWGDTFNVGLR